MPFSLKSLAAYAIAASVPTFALAQSTTQPLLPTTPPAVITIAPSAMPQSPVMQAMPARRASKIIGANIYNEENNNIGEVQDLMISVNGPTVAVLSVGGFLGIGDRYVTVPLSELQWNSERERWMMRGATAESLKTRPAFAFPDNS